MAYPLVPLGPVNGCCSRGGGSGTQAEGFLVKECGEWLEGSIVRCRGEELMLLMRRSSLTVVVLLIGLYVSRETAS